MITKRWEHHYLRLRNINKQTRNVAKLQKSTAEHILSTATSDQYLLVIKSTKAGNCQQSKAKTKEPRVCALDGLRVAEQWMRFEMKF